MERRSSGAVDGEKPTGRGWCPETAVSSHEPFSTVGPGAAVRRNSGPEGKLRPILFSHQCVWWKGCPPYLVFFELRPLILRHHVPSLDPVYGAPARPWGHLDLVMMFRKKGQK